MAARIDSPLRLYSRSPPERRRDHLLDIAGESFAYSVTSTFANLPRGEFDGAVALLADRRRTVYTSGGRFTQALAEMLHAHLYQLRTRTRLIGYIPQGRADALLDVSRRDVVVIFDARRYQKDTIALAEVAKKQGATIVLITDPWLSPIADLADHVLTVDVDAPSPHDTLVPSIALVIGIVSQLGDAIRRRISTLELLRKGYTWDDQEIPQYPGERET